MVYFVATPIGNMSELTPRAAEVLGAVSVIFCEDTAHSRPLLARFGIKKPLKSYHKFNERSRLGEVIEAARAPGGAAVISDAGMPGISDPGSILVNALIQEGIPYTVISGACALVNAAVLSGMCGAGFRFVGFLPEASKERAAMLEELSFSSVPVIFYCAPHDVDKTAADILAAFGDRRICFARELTKLHEQVIFGSLAQGYPGEKRGEFVLVVTGAPEVSLNMLTIEEHLKHYMAAGMDGKTAVKRVASDRKAEKNEIYQEYIKLTQFREK
ncbi:MAG: 16S rRNA (cytidine(1402)-2'-O)-methyltransferase [Firmicutes bacterium]|nr:16S rRNA (cytidine(1402)-2'-O)-methyltransferase [Bacillota bacterium]